MLLQTHRLVFDNWRLSGADVSIHVPLDYSNLPNYALWNPPEFIYNLAYMFGFLVVMAVSIIFNFLKFQTLQISELTTDYDKRTGLGPSIHVRLARRDWDGFSGLHTFLSSRRRK